MSSEETDRFYTSSTTSGQYYETTKEAYKEPSEEFEEYDEDSIVQKVSELQDKLEVLQRDIEDYLNDEGEDI